MAGRIGCKGTQGIIVHHVREGRKNIGTGGGYCIHELIFSEGVWWAGLLLGKQGHHCPWRVYTAESADGAAIGHKGLVFSLGEPFPEAPLTD